MIKYGQIARKDLENSSPGWSAEKQKKKERPVDPPPRLVLTLVRIGGAPPKGGAALFFGMY